MRLARWPGPLAWPAGLARWPGPMRLARYGAPVTARLKNATRAARAEHPGRHGRHPGPHRRTGEQEAGHPWWQVVCLTGVDYFSTIGWRGRRDAVRAPPGRPDGLGVRADHADLRDHHAAICLAMRDEFGLIPHVYFDWTEGSPLLHFLRFILWGSGEVASVTREVLRRAEPDRSRRPHVHVG